MAPWIPLLVVVPEFIQHCVEINIGMFASRDAARALGADPQRLLFGYVKVAGLVAATLAAAGFWARHQGGKVLWRAAAIAVALNVAATGVMAGLEFAVPDWTSLDIALSIATLPLLVLLVGALFGDRAMTLPQAYRSGWLIAVRLLVLVAAGWIPLSQLHRFNHLWAMGQAQPLVWGLMVFDALVVGLMACWVGTAVYRGYGPTRAE
ncbi:MAG: hypothetical protein ABL914_01410 [Novosphingobium sp.]|uniref:hypothetical protein n=1 Tax=Novosphingobium sp. TaxID=1874826 RepID=UPI0032BE1821